MKLAIIDSNGIAHCLICSWDWKVPSYRRGSGRGLKNLVLLSKEERVSLLEERILAHLRSQHDRILITREEVPLKDDSKKEELGSLFQKVYYHGRSLFR